MSEKKPTAAKLSYVSALYKVKLELTREICMQSPQPPTDLAKRAQVKMDSVRQAGEIQFFELYYEKLKSFWKALAADTSIPLTQKILFTMAEGCPVLKGLQVEVSSSSKGIVNLTINATVQEVQGWKCDWIELYINQALRQAGSSDLINSAQIHGSWLRACAGEKIENVALGAKPVLGSTEDLIEKPYQILANKMRQEVVLVIRHVKTVCVDLSAVDVLKIVKDAAAKVSAQFGGEYFILKKELTQNLALSGSSAQLLGFDLPVVLLGACSINAAVLNQSQNANYPGAGKLKIECSKENTQAHISDFDMSIYQDTSFLKDDEWLRAEIKRHGISDKACAIHAQEIAKMLYRFENLEGVCVAEGKAPVGGQQPYLYPVYKETSNDPAASQSDDKLDIRALQQRSIVKIGQLVAEIRYRIPSKPGWDVFGNEIESESNEPLNVEVKDGIKVRGSGKYYAAIGGVPVVDTAKNSVAISQVMIHHGDVNLRSGNIIFNGPVEISGSVESGARVEVTGALTILGAIRGGMVQTGASLRVKGGILTGKTGFVSAKETVEAEFIENSKVECGGDLTVKKVIINSDVICGGSIILTDQVSGVLAGGNIACRENIYTATLAFKNGAVTNLNVGVDWRMERKVRIRRKRTETIEKVQANDRLALRELLSRKNQEKNAKTQERKDYYQKRLQKARILADQAQRLLVEAETLLAYNPNSKILVTGTAYANCRIQIGGGPVNLTQDMAEVAILAKRKHGSKIVTLEVGQKMEEEDLQ